MVKETGLKIAFIKKNKPALSTICARQSRCEINTPGTGRCENRGSQSPGMPPAATSPRLSPWPSWANRRFFVFVFRSLCCAPHGYYSMKMLCGLPAVLCIDLPSHVTVIASSKWMCSSTNNKPFSPCIPSHKLSNNTEVTGEKKAHLMSSMSN